MEPTLYKILQVDPEAEVEVIAAAYRRLARKYHPDVDPSPEASERMKEINAAFEILSDAAQRAAYDRQLRMRGERRFSKVSHAPDSPSQPTTQEDSASTSSFRQQGMRDPQEEEHRGPEINVKQAFRPQQRKRLGCGFGGSFVTILIIIKLISALARSSEYQSSKEQSALTSASPIPTSTLTRKTPTLRPTMAPKAVSTPYQNEEAYFIETFDSPSTIDWELGSFEDSIAEIHEGQFYLTIKKPNWSTWHLYAEDFTDFTVEVDATQVNGPAGSGYGVVLREQDEDNFYLIWISEAEEIVCFYKLVSGSWEYEVDPCQQTSAILSANNPNHLKITAVNADISVRINGRQVLHVVDYSFSHGHIGMYADTSDKAGNQVAFDNLSVTKTEAKVQALVAEVTALTDLNVRSGPGTQYSIVGVLEGGETAHIVGKSADGSWWQIEHNTGRAWVSAASEYSRSVNTSSVPVFQALPLPLVPPSPTSVIFARSTDSQDSSIHTSIADKIIKDIPYYGKYTAEDLTCQDFGCPRLFPDLMPSHGNVTLWVQNLWREEMTFTINGIEHLVKPLRPFPYYDKGLIFKGKAASYEYTLFRPGQDIISGECDLATPDAIYAAYLDAGGWYSCFQLWP